MDKMRRRMPEHTRAIRSFQETVESLRAQGYYVLTGEENGSQLIVYSRLPWHEAASQLVASAQPEGVHA